jgi:outer membrane receptor protein involved in Fe transport
VPISIEVYSGEEISKQGYRDMDELADFSPTVLIAPDLIEQDTSIRGFGTTGHALTLEQAVPMFVDGIHYGRMSQIKTAFMDVQRVEVLKGPQPVFFGQNATAGAFNIESRGPTPVWQGNAEYDVGVNNSHDVNVGVGGPINDHWGVRVAGKYETTDGYLADVVSRGDLGQYETSGGRVILRWTPNDRFEASTKIEASSLSKDPEGVHACLTGGGMIFGRGGPTVPGDEGDERSVWAEPPKGEGWGQDHALDYDCFGSNKGVSAGGPYYDPVDYAREENSDTGMLDVREAADGFASANHKGILGYEDLDSNTAYLDLTYEFANGVELNSLTGYSRYVRNYARDNSYSPFFMNFQNREEDFDQRSSELRFSSPSAGGIEWVAGVFWQETRNDIFSSSLRANVRTGQRYNDIWEDTKWLSTFGNITFNFLDDKASLDLGGRYSEIDKAAFARGYGATWVFDVTPTHPDAVRVDPATARIYVAGADADNLWTIPYNVSRDTPDEWRGTRARAVGLTAPDFSVREGPYLGDFGDSDFNPQVSFRYRFTDALSVYAKWSESFKAGGFDTGQTTLPDTFEEYAFGPEFADNYEVGVKGTLMEGRLWFDFTLFDLTFRDLQLSSATPNPDDPFVNLNAGEQRVKGAEFSAQIAVTERMRLSLAGAFMDGKMTDYPGAGCTVAELATAPASGCDPETGTIDRTGFDAPRTPDYKLVFGTDYSLPVLGHYQLTLNADAYVSDGYLTDVNGFSKVLMYDTHGDLSVALGFSDLNGRWLVSVYGRNLLEARPSYHPEYDVTPDGFEFALLGPSAFKTYGVKFTYGFF